ncbi:MAG: hypothetical protein JWN14_2872 [Chthonomonadales bacterium]|nr:hypothetical protein [Chthonomonadales bacterium]
MHTRIHTALVVVSLFCYGFAVAGLPIPSFAQALPGATGRALSINPQLVLQNGHARDVEAVAFSSNGKLMATGGADGTVKIWDVRTSSILHSLPADRSWPYLLAFSPDSKVLALFLGPGKAYLLDSSTGKRLRSLNHGSEPTSIAFSPDSTTLALGGADESISLWNYRTGTHLRSIRAHIGWVGMLRFSAEGSLLACSGGEMSMGKQIAEIWNVRTGDLFRTVNTSGEVYSAAFSPDDRTVALGTDAPGNNGNIELWDLKRAVLLKKLGGGRQVTALSYSPDGSTLVAADVQGIIRVWNPMSGAMLRRMGETSFMVPVTVSPETHLAAVCPHGGSVHLYDTNTGKLINLLGVRSHEMQALAVCEDGKTLVVAGGRRQAKTETGEVLFWDTRTGSFKGALSWGQSALESLSVTQDGRLLAVTDGDTVALWDVPGKRLLGLPGTVPNERRRFSTVVLSPDGRTLAISGDSKRQDADTSPSASAHPSRPERAPFFELWDVATQTKLRTFVGAKDGVATAAFSLDGTTLFSNGARNDILVWDVHTGAIRKKLFGAQGSINILSLSPDGSLLAALGDIQPGQVWNVQKRGKPLTFPVSIYNSNALTVSPHRRQVANGEVDGSVEILDIAAAKRLRRLGGDGTIMLSIAYLPDGKSLVGLDKERGIRIWDLQTGRLKATLMPLGGAEDTSGSDAWIAFTPDGYYAASERAEAYLRWRVEGQLGGGEQYQAERRQPSRIDQSLTGTVRAGLRTSVLQAAALWQARPQVDSPVSKADVRSQQPASEAPPRVQEANAQLRKALFMDYRPDDPKSIARIVREIKLALENGADLNFQTGAGTSALMFLAFAGDFDSVKDLVHRGVKLDASDYQGSTALLHAVAGNHPEIVQFLLAAGADLKDVHGHSLLPLRGHPEVLGAALVATQDRPASFHTGPWTKEEDAQWRADLKLWQNFDADDTALLLLQFGALPNIRDKKGRTAIQYAGSIAVVQALMAHGADLNPESKDSFPPIVEWASAGRLDLIKVALEHGVNVNTVDKARWTALTLAAQNGHTAVAQFLLDRHADPNLQTDDGRTPLKLAISQGHLEIVRLLLSHGAKLEAKDRFDGWTALTYAVNRQDREIVRLLLERGANVHVLTNEGEGLLNLLKKSGKGDPYNIAALLKRAGCVK